jgi:hypothetical protein
MGETMPGRHQERPHSRPGLRWVAGAVGIAVAGAAIFATAPSSSAATTVSAQLSLSGVATSSNVLGGTTIGVHPGDTVDFKASALPTAGLENIPSLGTLLSTLLSGVLGQYQVVVHLGSTFPGGARTVTLGGPTSGVCAGASHLPVTFPNTGTYGFTWTVQYVIPTALGCTKNGLSSTDLNLLKSAGIAINASNQWTGQIVVAENPPPGGISVQLPGVSVAPSVTGIGQLPTIGLSPISVPTIPLDVSGVVSGLPSISGLPPIGGSTAPGGGPTGECVPCEVLPNPGNFPGFGGVGPDANSVNLLGAGLHDFGALSGSSPSVTRTAGPVTTKKTIELASNKAPAAQVPVVLAILAIIALSLVTATYARLYLLRRNV